MTATLTAAAAPTPPRRAATDGRVPQRADAGAARCSGWLYAAPTALFVLLLFVAPAAARAADVGLATGRCSAATRARTSPRTTRRRSTNRFFWDSIVFTLKYTVLTTVILLALGLGLALLVQESTRWKGLLRTVVPRAERARPGIRVAALLRALLADRRPASPT